MADPRRTGTEEAARIAREGKAVLLIGANVHATEIGSSQMAITLLHQLATERRRGWNMCSGTSSCC